MVYVPLLGITSKCQKPSKTVGQVSNIEQTPELKMSLTFLTPTASLKEAFFKTTVSQNAI